MPPPWIRASIEIFLGLLLGVGGTATALWLGVNEEWTPPWLAPLIVVATVGYVGLADGVWVLAERFRAPLPDDPEQEPTDWFDGTLFLEVTRIGAGVVLALCGLILIVLALVTADDRSAWFEPQLAIGSILLGGGALVAVLSGVLLWIYGTESEAVVPFVRAPPSAIPRWHVALLVVLSIVAVLAQLTVVDWFIEDSAITFAYARNWVEGHGLVTNVGGERVEGYSNPLWLLLVALGELAGYDGFASSKVYGVVFGAATVPLVYLITREARPHRIDAVPVFAAVILALNPQAAIWSASGLENSLFNFLLAVGIWRVAVELRHEGRALPLSAIAFLLLSVTRPEAGLYTAIAGLSVFAATVVRIVADLLQGKKVDVLWPAIYVAAWAFVCIVPFVAYLAVKWWYFSWFFPNTYYAKREHKTFNFFGWSGAGWNYVRNYALTMWQGFFLPAYVLGIVGSRRARGIIAVVALIAIAVIFLYPPPGGVLTSLKAPGWWNTMRPIALAVMAVGLPFFAIGRRGSPALIVSWAMGIVAVGFTVWSTGDWMKGYRWLDMVAVPASVLLACGAGELGDAVHRAIAPLKRPLSPILSASLAGGLLLIGALVAGWFAAPMGSGFATLGGLLNPLQHPKVSALDLEVASALLGAFLFIGVVAGLLDWLRPKPLRWGILAAVAASFVALLPALPNAHHLDWFTKHEETSPRSVRKRANYTNWVKKRLHLDHLVTLDVDMGAHMFWADQELVDIAGLVDVSMGHHRFEKPFIHEYIFVEKKPHIAHVHGGWAGTSKIPTHPEWKAEYLEIPGYPTGEKSVHGGNHIRRDLVVETKWHGTEGRAYALTRGVRFDGWEVPAGEASPKGGLYLEVGLSVPPIEGTRQNEEPFRAIAFLSDDAGHLASWELPPGYDWLPPKDWRADEVFYGKFSLLVPEDLPVGTYDLGFVVLWDRGEVLTPDPLVPLPVGAVAALGDVPARYATGEVRFPQAVRIVPREELLAHADDDLADLNAKAGARACQEAEDAWRLVRQRTALRETWIGEKEPAVSAALVACWTEKGRAATAREERVSSLERARYWDSQYPELLAAAGPLGQELYEEGLVAREAKDWETAYRKFSDALRVSPTLAWARRYAEEARDYRLGIDDEAKAQAVVDKEKRQDDVRKRREEKKDLLHRPKKAPPTP